MSPIQHEITRIWGEITAATHRFLELVAEFDDAEGWNGDGIVSCAHWLNVHCGIDIVTAREKVRVAHAIRKLPGIDAAFRQGRITYSKVRAMVRVATPENEDDLLNIAIHGTAAHVERTVRLFRRVERIEDARRAAQSHRDRYLDIRYDDGAMMIHGRLPAEVGALVRKAIERAMELENQEANEPPVKKLGSDDSAESSGSGPSGSASSRPRPPGPESEDAASAGARRADALKLIATRFLADEARNHGASSDRYQVIVHIDQAVLSDTEPRSSESGARAASEIEDGPALAAETVRRLACDASLVGIVNGTDGEPLSVGRKTRSIPPALRRALKARDGGCRFPGCAHTRFTEGHHVRHWADGGETKLSNLITLCDHHHRLVHESGYQIERTDDATFRFLRPDGTLLCEDFSVDGRFRGIALVERNRRRNIRIEPDTVATRWQGETMDYSLAIDALLAAQDAAQEDDPGYQQQYFCRHIPENE